MNNTNNNLKLNLKGLENYNKIFNNYISKYNNKNLILNLKKDQLINSELNNNNNNNTIIIENKDNSISSNKLLFKYNQEINYNFNSANDRSNLANWHKLYSFLLYSFSSMNSLISKPIFEVTNQKVIIRLFFYLFSKNNNKENFLTLNQSKLNALSTILSKYFKKPVEFDLVRLHYPYLDSNIFVNLLHVLVNKIQLRIIMQKFFKKAIIKNPNQMKLDNNLENENNIPSFLSGIKIKIGGRLLTHKVVPRQTSKIIRRGAISRQKINFLDIARFTNKNKRGTFTITISSGHFLI